MDSFPILWIRVEARRPLWRISLGFLVQADRSSAAGNWQKNSGIAVKAVCQGPGDFGFSLIGSYGCNRHSIWFKFYSPVDMDLQDRWRKKLRNRAIQFTGHQFTWAIFFFLTTRLSAWRRQYWVNFGFKLLLHFDFSDGGNYKEGLRAWLSPVPVAWIFRHDAQDLDWVLNCFCHILSSDSE